MMDGPRARSIIFPVLAGVALAETLAFAWARLWIQAANGNAIFGLDLWAYREGAARLIATGSPYHEALAAGPIDNVMENVSIAYLYPPPLAQAFVPFVAVDHQLLSWVWAIAQVAALAVLLPLVYRRFGGALSATSILSLWTVAVLFYPMNIAVFIGNLSGWFAVGIAVTLLGPGRPAGVAAALMALSKLTPTILLVPAIIRRESRASALLAVGGITLISAVLAPEAWAQWISLLGNILRFPAAAAPSNLAPVAVLGALGFESAGTVLGLSLAAVAIAASIALAIKGSWPAAIAAATTAFLFAPTTLWDHYLAILLPIIIAAWPGCDRRTRTVLVLFVAISMAEWLAIEMWLPVRTLYLASAILAAVAGTVWLAQRDAEQPSPRAVLA
jgi:hypothetical protein